MVGPGTLCSDPTNYAVLCVSRPQNDVQKLPLFCATTKSLSQRYSQTNLVSDIPGLAKITDKSLVNALGNCLWPNQSILDCR